MNELEKIAERYKRRENISFNNNGASLFSSFIVKERELIYEREILKHFQTIKDLRVLEIGAGGGGNIDFFKKIGIEAKHIYANELLKERINHLRVNHPDIHIIEGDACDMEETIKYDIVFQSTVFTSILDSKFKEKLAKKMIGLVNENGIILWYDFIYDNPSNKDVKGISKREIHQLFKDCKSFNFISVTLAPPIGRRIGRLYSIINILFPFLRTHTIAIIKC